MTKKQAGDARQIIGQLDRASHGDMQALQKVYYYSYGRGGPRRRQLLSNGMELLSASDAVTPPPHPPVFPPPNPRHGRAYHDNDRGRTVPVLEVSPTLTGFQQFLKDQEAFKPDVGGRNKKIKYLDPPIGKYSIWGKPVARKRERGMTKAWVSDTLESVMPPLPKLEWEYLRRIATGEIEPEAPPSRRTKVGDWGEEGYLTVWNLKNPVHHAFRSQVVGRVMERKRHVLTPKFLKRMHASIWHVSCKMEWSEEHNKWKYTWGKDKASTSQGKKARLLPRDLQLFEGMEAFNGADQLAGMAKRRRAKIRKQMEKEAAAAAAKKENLD